MLYLSSEPAFVPSCNLLVLHDYTVVGFQLVDQLVRFILFSVREFLVLPLDKLDSFIAII